MATRDPPPRAGGKCRDGSIHLWIELNYERTTPQSRVDSMDHTQPRAPMCARRKIESQHLHSLLSAPLCLPLSLSHSIPMGAGSSVPDDLAVFPDQQAPQDDNLTLQSLRRTTYLDEAELRVLYTTFARCSDRRGVHGECRLSYGVFIERFPEFGQTRAPRVLFEALDDNKDDSITFASLCKALSTMCRGTVEDKVRLTFKMCDVEGTGEVWRQQALRVFQDVWDSMAEINWEMDTFMTPDETIEALFSAAEGTADASKEERSEDDEPEEMDGTTTILRRGSTAPSSAAALVASFLSGLRRLSEEEQNTTLSLLCDNLTPSQRDHLSATGSPATTTPEEGTTGGKQLTADLKTRLLHRRCCRRPSVLLTTLGTTSPVPGDAPPSLNADHFVGRGVTLPDVAQCFGLFRYIPCKVLASLEAPAAAEKEGSLIREEKVVGLFSQQHRRWVLVRRGFMAWFKGSGDAYPVRVVSLRDATVKIKENSLKDHYVFRLYTPMGHVQKSTWAASGEADRRDWMDTIRLNAGTRDNRFSSFAPKRRDVTAQWLVNADEYFAELARSLMAARREIFIAGWFLTPMLYLTRGGDSRFDDRLDHLLATKANEGVEIYILLWNETEIGQGSLDSAGAKRYLESMHSRIRVIRHPWVTPMAWSHHEKIVVVDQQTAFVGGIDLAYMRYDDRAFDVADELGIKFPGRDYGNLHIGAERAGRAEADQSCIDRKRNPRLPWHDVAVKVTGDAAQDVGCTFIQRWNHARDDTFGQYNHFPYLFPRNGSSPSMDSGGSQVCQITRSLSAWSGGLIATENSIYKAYTHAIHTSQHFVYIENPFFLSATTQSPPLNRVAQVLLSRVRRAILDGEAFRVIVVLPVHPAGPLQSLSTRYIQKWTQNTLFRKEWSMLNVLRREFPDVNLSDFISFYSLRTYGYVGSRAVTVPIYVHGKIMLVDDRVAIIGSANINDRSLVGDRDSEISVVVEDTNVLNTTMGGQPFPVGHFAHTLRLRLWRDWLGLEDTDASDMRIRDPIAANVFENEWRMTAEHNTRVYEASFDRIHDDRIRKLSDLNRGVTPRIHPIAASQPIEHSVQEEILFRSPRSLSETRRARDSSIDEGGDGDEQGRLSFAGDPQGRREALNSLRGHLVHFPMYLLIDEPATRSLFTQEFFVERDVWL